MSLQTNILVLGKSGVGKSALLNYLWGEEMAPSGTGRPVTGEGIHRYGPIRMAGLDVVIYDSWGIEADKAARWEKILDDEVQAHEASDKVSDWIHTVIYCISAKGARVEPFEIESVLRPLMAKGHRICFALTKADIASEVEKRELADVLREEFPDATGIIEVSSESKRLRSGVVTERFGRSELISVLRNNLWDNLSMKIPRSYSKQYVADVKLMRTKVLGHFEKESSNWLPKDYESILKECSRVAVQHFTALEKKHNGRLVAQVKEALEILGQCDNALFDARYRRVGEHFAYAGREELVFDLTCNSIMDFFAKVLMKVVMPPFVQKNFFASHLEDKLKKIVESSTQSVRNHAQDLQQLLRTGSSENLTGNFPLAIAEMHSQQYLPSFLH